MKKCPSCENTIPIVLDMCASCSISAARRRKAEELTLERLDKELVGAAEHAEHEFAEAGTARLEAYLGKWARFEDEHGAN